MTTKDPNDLERVDQEIRINELKEQVREAAGGQMQAWESEDSPPEVTEKFWQNIAAFENGPKATFYERLLRRGVKVPAPDELDDESLAAKLGELIEQLAELNVFMTSTDHLDDRDLFTHLWDRHLHDKEEEMPSGPAGAHTSASLAVEARKDVYYG